MPMRPNKAELESEVNIRFRAVRVIKSPPVNVVGNDPEFLIMAEVQPPKSWSWHCRNQKSGFLTGVQYISGL